jgi:hypothetical protein
VHAVATRSPRGVRSHAACTRSPRRATSGARRATWPSRASVARRAADRRRRGRARGVPRRILLATSGAAVRTADAQRSSAQPCAPPGLHAIVRSTAAQCSCSANSTLPKSAASSAALTCGGAAL